MSSMGWRYLISCALVGTCAVAVTASQERRAESDQQALIKLEQGWNEAFYRQDVAFIQNILADEFMATYDDGTRGDKAKELALVREFNQQVESADLGAFLRCRSTTAISWQKAMREWW